MPKKIAVGLVLVLAAGGAFGGAFSVQVKASYFLPGDSYFKSIYGNAPTFGVKIGLDVWKGLGVWVDAEYLARSGKTTVTAETTDLTLIPITGGIRYAFSLGKNILPYLGAGVGYFLYEEKNAIANVSKGDIGYVGLAGVMIKFGRTVFVDIQGSYSTCKVNPAGVEAELGGVKAGLGLGVSF
jgi:opacity protein-like surface antigen